MGSNKYFVTGDSHMRQDIVDDETREEGEATSWSYLNIIFKSTDPNQLVMVSKETAHVPHFSLSMPKVDITNRSSVSPLNLVTLRQFSSNQCPGQLPLIDCDLHSRWISSAIPIVADRQLFKSSCWASCIQLIEELVKNVITSLVHWIGPDSLDF